MKGVSGLITFVLTVGIIITTITLVWVAGKPVIDKSEDSALISESNNVLASIDSVIKDVVYEKGGASRVVSLSITGGKYSIKSSDSSIEFSLDTKIANVEPSGQIKNGNLYKSGARDSSAYQTTVNGVDSLVLENSHIVFAIRNIPTTSAINTSNLTVLVRNKDINLNLTPTDSSVIVNDLSSTALGTGTTYFVDNGTKFGYSQIVAHVISGSVDYYIYYTLHSNADFVSIDIRNSTTVNNVTFSMDNTISGGSGSTATNYVTYSNSSIGTALYHNGNTLKSISVTGSKMQLKQDYAGNGVMFVATKGLSSISGSNVADINKWSGSFGYGINKKPKYYSWLYYPIINITNNETLSKGSYKIYIYNNGTSNGKAQLEIKII